jgi:hypothetical protein
VDAIDRVGGRFVAVAYLKDFDEAAAVGDSAESIGAVQMVS